METNLLKIAENFSRHIFEETYPSFSDNIEWHLIGDKTLISKKDIIETCNQSAQYLINVTTNFIYFKIIADHNTVVIDSLADYIDNEQKSSRIASCDIYHFSDNKLVKIKSYVFEIKNQIEK